MNKKSFEALLYEIIKDYFKDTDDQTLKACFEEEHEIIGFIESRLSQEENFIEKVKPIFNQVIKEELANYDN
jgi:hypothetical protein